jgi:hypothetical protein
VDDAWNHPFGGQSNKGNVDLSRNQDHVHPGVAPLPARRYTLVPTIHPRLALIAAITGLLVVVPTAAAGKGKPGSGGSGGSGGSVTLQPLYTHTGGPWIGDQVTFTLSTSATFPYVKVECYQGSLVYSQTHGFFPTYPWGQTYQLGPTSKWTAGSASCKATLFTTSGTKTSTLGTTSFTVSG